MLKHRHVVLIQDLPVLKPSLSRSTGSLIATNIGDLFTEYRAARLNSDTLHRRKEDKGSDTLLGAAYRALLSLNQRTDLTVRTIPSGPHSHRHQNTGSSRICSTNLIGRRMHSALNSKW